MLPTDPYGPQRGPAIVEADGSEQSRERLDRLLRLLVIFYCLMTFYLVGEWTGLLDTVNESAIIPGNAVPYYTIVSIFGAAGSGLLYLTQKRMGVYLLGASMLATLFTNLFFPMQVSWPMWVLGLGLFALLAYLIWRFWQILV